MPERRRAAGLALAAAVLVLPGCAATPGAGEALLPRTAGPTSAGPQASVSVTVPAASTEATTPSGQAGLLARLPGPADGSCTPTPQRNLRSGGIGAGDFVRAREAFKAGGSGRKGAEIRLHVIPAHPRQASGATVVLTRLRKPAVTARATATRARVTPDGVRYYALRVTVPGPGTWRAAISAGRDHGCFTIAFNRRAQ
ncbi:hypothetical protein H9L10_01430 [Phycicoccus endophyticus]|uniref:Uncharacterized protein n=1 Tax=Phycicoccus endophyticus TaxID=1690220 RepID=A0A7G9R2G1_9MICO|nr:hypothetical protein [Phycicoccus endophyticus]NHI20829.1 hypothetical protein [Phycicoccus endophyticus]QNN49786.1 hypothetical protein H9L10_01430 [Phycicoccus endophyticus]GGL35147.1 hypothetical protein GCM10012283_16950 [Phycicoccus endophyticus]